MDQTQRLTGSAADESPRCPYCYVVLPKRPQRKTKCKACGQPIFVKTRPDTRERVLATAEEAQAIEAEWAARAQSQATEGLVRRYHLDEAIFQQRRATAGAPPDRDIIWGMFNEDLHALLKRGDLHGAKCRYYEMALFVGEEDRNFIGLLEACHRADLQLMKLSGIKRVQIAASVGCDACRSQDGKVFTVDEALRTVPLPCTSCTMVVVGTRPGFCRCLYAPMVN